ncbi:MAG: hypothetical protein ACJA0N_001132 [Pseudohongiellaceae bacterium]|jgi:hypothetical protein
MSTADSKYSKTNKNLQAIYGSWSNIKRSEKWTILCTTKKDWLNVIRLCQSRQKLVDQHFDNYPVCPETAFFYHHHLSDHFKNNDLIQQARSIAVKNTLRLI